MDTTVLVPTGSVRVIEFVAEPGDWALHCHMTHHVMNQMGHDAENAVGADLGEASRKSRALVVAARATAADLRADGIDPG